MKLKERSAWLFAPITTQEDAERVIKDLAKGWYALAGLQAVVGLILFFSGKNSVNFISDVPVLLLGGYFLQKNKSRTFSFVLLAYALSIAGLTIASRLGQYEGGKNVVLALLLVWIAYRGVRATFVYHAQLRSEIIWKNVAIVSSIAIAITLVVFVLAVFAFVIIEQRGLQIGTADDTIGMYLLGGIIAALSICFITLPRRFPTTRLQETLK